MESKILNSLNVEFFTNLSTKIADKAMELIQEEFDTSRDPYSHGWAPTKRKNQILVDTGNLRSNFNVYDLSADGFIIANHTPYAIYHQRGTKEVTERIESYTTKSGQVRSKTYRAESAHGIAQRKMLPDDNTMPYKWSDEFSDIFSKLIKEIG